MKIKILPILIALVLVISGCGIVKQTVPALSTDNTAAIATPKPSPMAEPAPESTSESSNVEGAEVSGENSDIDVSESPYEREAKRDLLALMMAYPNHIVGVERADGLIYVAMRSGSKIVYDDMQSKSFEEKLASADIQDMMELIYPLEDSDTLMEGDFDPGRIRNYDLLIEVYGDSQDTIEANLEPVETDSKTYLFNGKNRVAQTLTAVFTELNDTISDDRAIAEFVYPLASTYYYRVIAGTERLSMHSFGIAVDLKNVKTDYWREATREQGQARLDVFPKEIVKIFEENGFIWGGKWAHFDLLHFEYRPELIIKSKYDEESVIDQPWYQGFPETEETMKLIEKINRAFGDS